MVFPWRFHIPVSWAAVPSRSAAISPWLATAKCASRGMPLRSPPRWHRAWQRQSRSLGLWQRWGSWQKDLFQINHDGRWKTAGGQIQAPWSIIQFCFLSYVFFMCFMCVYHLIRHQPPLRRNQVKHWWMKWLKLWMIPFLEIWILYHLINHDGDLTTANKA